MADIGKVTTFEGLFDDIYDTIDNEGPGLANCFLMQATQNV